MPAFDALPASDLLRATDVDLDERREADGVTESLPARLALGQLVWLTVATHALDEGTCVPSIDMTAEPVAADAVTDGDTDSEPLAVRAALDRPLEEGVLSLDGNGGREPPE